MAPHGDTGFAVRESNAVGARDVQVLPDLATCDACLDELFDPANRRFRYPFINCTQCGPRYSIVEDLPYDRARTSMGRFALCPACRAEYDDPVDRRFHAEPNACIRCGPRLALWDHAGTVVARDDEALFGAADAIRSGQVVAIKGVGGFHLFVDARDETAVRRLRAAKHRPEKPFAVMFPTLNDVRQACRLDETEAALLTGPARPIVLVRRQGRNVAASVAPDSPRLGVLLPYAPVHHLLMADLGFPVVATSGNVADEPIVTDEADALTRLAGIADLFLVHDRPIVRPIDDSVAQVVCGAPQLLRRARGYAPAPIAAASIPAGILAFGGHLKATVALTRAGSVVSSQHLGDLDTVAARSSYGRAVGDLATLQDARPRRAACDLHPDYASTRAAADSGLPVVPVQHHVAHVAACMAEHGLEPPVLGVAWDGTGYGPDGTIWGGEFLRLTRSGWQRVAHLRPFRLPGGAAAVREPRRAALGLLFAAYGDDAFAMTDLAPVADFAPAEREIVRRMLRGGVNAPVTTSAGRLFDGFAALCGVRQKAGYEGQAAMEFEWAADGCANGRNYRLSLEAVDDAPIVVDWQPALDAAIADLRSGVDAGAISAALHSGLAEAIASVAARCGDRHVALTGGCFQNVRLTEAAVAALDGVGCTPVLAPADTAERRRYRGRPGRLGGLAGNVGRRAMCLAVPGRILSVDGDDELTRTGRVDFGGLVKEINLAFVPDAAVGDHVLVHVGFAITVIDEVEAGRIFEHLRTIGEIDAEREHDAP